MLHRTPADTHIIPVSKVTTHKMLLLLDSNHERIQEIWNCIQLSDILHVGITADHKAGCIMGFANIVHITFYSNSFFLKYGGVSVLNLMAILFSIPLPNEYMLTALIESCPAMEYLSVQPCIVIDDLLQTYLQTDVDLAQKFFSKGQCTLHLNCLKTDLKCVLSVLWMSVPQFMHKTKYLKVYIAHDECDLIDSFLHSTWWVNMLYVMPEGGWFYWC